MLNRTKVCPALLTVKLFKLVGVIPDDIKIVPLLLTVRLVVEVPIKVPPLKVMGPESVKSLPEASTVPLVQANVPLIVRLACNGKVLLLLFIVKLFNAVTSGKFQVIEPVPLPIIRLVVEVVVITPLPTAILPFKFTVAPVRFTVPPVTVKPPLAV